MVRRCELDRREVEALVAELYEFSPATDVLCLNQARRMLQEKVVKWDIDFIEFEKNCIPSEKDIRRITTTHLKRLFSEKDPSEARSDATSTTLPPAAEIDESSTDAADGKAKDRASEKSDHQKSASASVASTRSVSAQAVEALALAGADLSVAPMLSDLVSQNVETPLSELPPVLTSSTSGQLTTARPQSDGKAPEAVSRSKTVPMQLNKVGRADVSKYRDGNFDDETDVADLSPVEVRPMISRRALSNPVTAPVSPTYSFSSKSRAPFDSVGFPRADESSCTESELVGSVSGLIRRFDSPRRSVTGPAVSASGASAPQSGTTDGAFSRGGVNGSIRRPACAAARPKNWCQPTARSFRGVERAQLHAKMVLMGTVLLLKPFRAARVAFPGLSARIARHLLRQLGGGVAQQRPTRVLSCLHRLAIDRRKVRVSKRDRVPSSGALWHLLLRQLWQQRHRHRPPRPATEARVELISPMALAAVESLAQQQAAGCL